ncbi:hypothetical protein ACC691_38440, partial [Rhizobium johnstonii]
ADERVDLGRSQVALIGNPTKAKTALGWEAHVRAPELAALMVDADIAALDAAGRPYIDAVSLDGWR